MIYGTPEYDALLKGVMVKELRHDSYAESVRHAKAMSVHVYGDNPFYLLERTRPREDPEVKAYRIENYEPTTKAGSDKSIDIVGKIFNPTLYSIRWQKESDQVENLKKYTLDYYPGYNSIMTFNKDVVLRKMIADPNGIMVVKPEYIPENDAEKVSPVVLLYGSECVYYYDRDHYLIYIKTEEKDVMVYNGTRKEKVFQFEYYDKLWYRRFYAFYDKESDRVITEEIEVYQHGFGEIPAWQLRGKSRSMDNGDIIFESYFSSALPHWNLAVIHESDLLGAYINHMHPQKYELAEECAYEFPWDGSHYPCRAGKVKYPIAGKGLTEMECPSCKGSGLVTVKSPYGAYQFTKQKIDEASTGGLMPVGYIEIQTEATKMLEERTNEMVRKGMWAINMDIEDKVGENQSGVAKVIDRSAQYDTLYTISCVMFDVHVNNEFYFINKYMNGVEASAAREEDDDNLPQVNKPVMFDIATVSELINNFSIASKSGLDRNFLRVKQIEILSRDMTTNPDMKEYLIMIINLDPLYGFTQEEISAAVMGGVVRREDWAIHDNIKSFIDRALEENRNFMKLKKAEKMAILEGYAMELIASQRPQVNENVFDAQPANQ